MTRPTLSVIVHAGEGWDLTRTCLEALRPQLGVRDEVVVVDDATTDQTAAGLTKTSWARVIRTGETVGAEEAWVRGVAEATGEVVLFVPSDALVPARALDALLAPFSDPDVGAVGPLVSGSVAPEQALPEGAATSDPQAFKAFAREWRDRNRDERVEPAFLDLRCLAVRRQVLDGMLDLQGVADVVKDGGLRLVVAREVVVLLRAGGDEPLLSACMIVKDEEEALPACLERLQGVVDEIVVYDTGSTDRTMEIAEQAGATVVRGYWDDDFGRARNASLEHCSGRWILHVDADELVVADRTRLVAALVERGAPDVYEIEIDNLSGNGDEVHLTHRARRLFRRERAHWVGRLHEQVVARDGQADLSSGDTDALRIKHTGYTADILASRDKPERNLRIALTALEHEAGERGQLLLNVARSYILNRQPVEALPYFAEARELSECPAPVRRQVLRHGAQALLQVGQPADALEWVVDLRGAGGDNALADYLEGLALANLGRADEALEILSRIDEIADDDVELSADVLPLQRGLLGFQSQQWAQAAEDLLTAARRGVHGRPLWANVVEAHHRAGFDLATVLDAVDDGELKIVLGQVLNAPPDAADALGEALWGRQPGDPRILAFSIRLAPRLDVSRALDWSVRLREAGHADRCPLVVLANDRARTSLDRVRAAAVLVVALDDQRGQMALKVAAAECEPAGFRAALVELDALAPQLLPDFVASAAVGGTRAMELAQVLHELGAPDEGVAVLLHGIEVETDDAVRGQAAAWLEEIGRTTEAERVRQLV